MKTTNKSVKAVALAVSSAFLLTVGASAVNAASENPFAIKPLSSGYQVADNHADKAKDGKCGEGKCGNKAKDGKCGEGKCGHGDKDAKAKDGKCGEGKCGAEMKDGAKTDAKMKDGKCGEGKCGTEKAK